MNSSSMNATSEDIVLPGFCNDPLWSPSISWNTEDQQFSWCIQRTLFVWTPCLVLWLTAPFYTLTLARRPYDRIPLSTLAYTKLGVVAVLMLAAAVESVWVSTVYDAATLADHLASPVLLVTYFLYMLLLISERRRGKRSSGALWSYWLVTLIGGSVQLSTAILSIIQQDQRMPTVLVATFMIQYLGYIILFVASSINDVPSRLQELAKTQNPNPEAEASCLNRLLFLYNYPLIIRGWRRPLVYQDLPDVLPKNSTEAVYRKWRNTMEKKKGSAWDDFMEIGKAPIVTTQSNVKISLIRHIWRQSQSTMILLLLRCLFLDSVTFLDPVLVGWLIGFMSNVDEPSWHGYLYAVMLVVIGVARSLLRNKYTYDVVTTSFRINTTLQAVVYNKAIHLSSSSRRKFTVGEIVNLMAVDAHTIGSVFVSLCNLVSAPFIILTTIAFVWIELGPSALAGLGVMAIVLPLNSHIMSLHKELQTEVMKLSDKRVKAINEIISGIKVLKLYAWEASFAEKVKTVRDEEIKILKKAFMLKALNTFMFQTTPLFVALATFTSYLLVSDENKLDAQKAFVCITLFDILRMPVVSMPEVIAKSIQAIVSVRRMERYLNAEELDPHAVSIDPRTEYAVVVEGGHFAWEGDEDQASWRLKGIEMKVPRGRLVALVGTVGSGKSSILSALLGEMKKEEGRVVVNGSIAYAPQHPWLQNATLRDNITWGQVYEPQRYHQVVRACALQPDFDMLPAADLTEIGENGINISGGQKQRVSLARAMYSNGNIFLLDDPFSAVDAHVGRHIFEHLFGPYGMLKDKTCILVTHSVRFLSQIEEIMVIEDGQVVQQGSYTALLASEGHFANLMVQHIKELDEDEADQEMALLCDQLESAACSNTKLYRQLSATRESMKSSQSNRGSVISRTTEHPHLQRQLSSDSRIQRQISTDSRLSNGSSIGSHSTIKEKHDISGAENKGHKLIEEEVSETGKVSYRVYFIYMRAMGVVLSILSFVGMALSQMSYAGSNIWLAHWSSGQSSVANITSTSSRDTFLVVYGILALGQSFFLFVGILMLSFGTLRAASFLHSELLRSVIRFPMSFFDTNPSGRIINRFGKEVNSVDKNLPMVLRSFLYTFVRVMTTLVVIIITTPIAASLMLPIMVVYFGIQRIFVATSRQAMRLESVSKSPIYSHFSETITGVSVIRAFKRQNEFFSQSLQKIDNSLKSIYTNVNINRWLCVHLETIGYLITFSAALFSVLNRHTISPGDVGLSVSYALSITFLLNWVVRVVSDLEASIVSVEKIDEYIRLPKEAAWRVDKSLPSPSWPNKGAIEFKNYETRYRPGLSLILHDITCFIRPGEKVGVVGRTGAGKSSLTLALFRIIEASSGEIKIDETTIANVGLHDVRSKISIIPQDAVLFSGTLRMNLDPLSQHTDEELWRVLELAHLSGYVRKQVLGIEHPVDQGGSNFSAGQRQLLCLARALLRNSQVLVLDEATAAVDLQTDDLIQTTIRTQFAECTVITIAHRLNTIMDSDRVMVLENGRIAEFDAPSVLLQNTDSMFYGMARDAGIV